MGGTGCMGLRMGTGTLFVFFTTYIWITKSWTWAGHVAHVGEIIEIRTKFYSENLKRKGPFGTGIDERNNKLHPKERWFQGVG
jgi:hypothetical protein